MKQKQTRRLTPLMGWASWNCFRTDISEARMREQADTLVQSGLAECGYTYLNMDDGFFGGRDEDGNLRFHEGRFPNGIKPVGEYAHSLGLQAGIYSEAGDNTCGFYYDKEGSSGEGSGLYGHEEQDLRMFLQECGFDFIKIDWCGGLRLGLDEQEQYTKIGRIIEQIRQETGRNIVFNICRWQFPGAWAAEVADSWRTAADIRPNFTSILHQLDNIKPLRKYCGPGHVNDLDMMQLGNGMTPTEERTHFSMWCMMSTPLMIGCDLTKIPDHTMAILKNRELIAINQDSACLQAYVAKEFCKGDKLLGEIWIKNLGKEESNRKAVAFLNRSEEALTMKVKAADLGLTGKLKRMRDLWKHQDLWRQQEMWKHQAPEAAGQEADDELTVNVAPRAVEVFLLEAEGACPVEDIYFAKGGTEIDVTVEALEKEQVASYLAKGAVLVDVRTEAEYAAGHEEGAINLPYTDIHGDAAGALHDKERPVIVYCTTGKRCSQAGQSLKYLGYRQVYRWARG